MSNRSIELEATLRLALEAFEYDDLPLNRQNVDGWDKARNKAITAIKEALMSQSDEAQPSVSVEQEPVAHSVVEPLRHDEYQRRVSGKWVNQPVAGPLYTTPPTQCNCSQRQCNVKPLTDEQKIVLGFLDGSNPLQGVWYGDDHPAFGRAKNWWRRFLRQAFADDFAAHGIKGDA